MPSSRRSWCDECQCYHHAEDEEGYNEEEYAREDDEEEEEFRGDIIIMPSNSSEGLLAALNARRAELPDIAVSSPPGYRPNNAHGWALESPGGDLIIWDAGPPITPGLSNTDITNIMRNYREANPVFSSNAWCSAVKHSTLPYHYAGEYVAAYTRYEGNTGFIRVLNETRYSCAHCAWVAAIAGCPEGKFPYIIQFSSVTPIHAEYMPNVEIIGEVLNTSATIKDVTENIPVACGNCGRVGHRSPTCEYPEKSHQKVGIEIEGRWHDINATIRRSEANNSGIQGGYSDSSIHNSNDSSARPWEFQTTPGSARVASQALVDFYPDETDTSCGMHVHVSFDALDITMLNSPSFFAYFKRRWTEWGNRMNLSPRSAFFNRLNGNNDFCLPATETPYAISRMDRYAQLNFSSFGEHGTVECRLLPMFYRASLGVSAVSELVDIYETFLANPAEFGHPGFAFKAKFIKPGIGYVEKLASIELEVPIKYTYRGELEMELLEQLPPNEGHIRIAMPINLPITLQSIQNAVRKRTA
jgi:hypothetical protein